MSGGDPRSFDTKCNASDVERLAMRMKNGLISNPQYKPAQYDKLEAAMDAARQELNLIEQKVQRSVRAAKERSEGWMLGQHRQVWSAECPRLQDPQWRIEGDIQDFLQQTRPSDRTDTYILSIQDYGLVLESDREAFRRATVEPVLQLRDDLHFRLREELRQPIRAEEAELRQVLQQINFVKEQQADITRKLEDEYRAVEAEIAALGLEQILSESWGNAVMEDVPEVLLDADCPYPELKSSLIKAFQSLSGSYRGRMESFRDGLHQTDRFCGWREDDHLQFTLIVSQYHQDDYNTRRLRVDMLQRVFPHRTRQELTDHERKWSWQRFTQSQLRALTQQWHRDHEELLARALVTLQEAGHAHQEALHLHRDRQQQREVCARLHGKLQKWREQQEEVATLEAAMASRRREAEEQRLRRERNRQAAVRSQRKLQVKEFHLKRQKKKEEIEERDQERLEKLRAVMEEQAQKDKQRVQFRAEMLQKRQEEREERETERQREEEEREKRLEALRNQVAVVADADPDRLMADTEAWKSRHMNMNDYELQKPLFGINTYTDSQIASDLRVRAEQALREAGLHNTAYAREVLFTIPPPRPPRKDTKSALKF